MEKAGVFKRPPGKIYSLNVGLGLAQTLDTIALLPLAALLEQGDAFEALEDIAFDDEAAGHGLETGMLGHKSGSIMVVSG